MPTGSSFGYGDQAAISGKKVLQTMWKAPE
jgi:hypothetical protein